MKSRHRKSLLATCVCLLLPSALTQNYDSSGFSVTGVTPSLGGVSGGTHVTIQGTGFSPSSTARCKFSGDGYIHSSSSAYSAATVVNDTTITCITPPYQAETQTNVFISLDGSTFSSSSTTFAYVRFVDVSERLSLYTCGDPSPVTASELEVLVKLDPLLDSTLPVDHRRFDPFVVADSGIAGASSPSSRRHNMHNPLTDPPPMPVSVSVSLGPHVLTTMTLPADGIVHRVPVKLSDVSTSCPFTATLDVTIKCSAPFCDTVPVRSVNFTAKPYQPYQVLIDYLSTGLVVGNAPFYMYGYLVDGKHPENVVDAEIQRLALQGGYNTLMVYHCGPKVEHCNDHDLTVANLDTAHTYGMKVQVTLLTAVKAILADPSPENFASVVSTINSLKTHPALLGWYITDDTINENVTIVRQVYQAVREADPYHPVFNTVSVAAYAWPYNNAFDVAQYESYDLNSPTMSFRTISKFWPMFYKSGAFCGQGYQDPDTLIRAPRVQVYNSLFGHSMGMVLWDYWAWTEFQSKAMQAAHVQMVGEVQELASGILSGLPKPAISILNPSSVDAPDVVGPVIGSSWQRTDGCVYIAVLNILQSPAEFTVSASFLPTTSTNNTLTVLYERRSLVVSLANGTMFNDTLDGWTSRIYFYDPTASPAATVSMTSFAANIPPSLAQGDAHDDVVPVAPIAPVVPVAPVVASTDNIVLNPGFEESVYPGYADKWSPLFKFAFDEQFLYDFNFFVDSLVAAPGSSHSLRITAPNIEDIFQPCVLMPIPLSEHLSDSQEYNFTITVRPTLPIEYDEFTVAFCDFAGKGVTYPADNAISYMMSPHTFTAVDAYSWHTIGLRRKGPVGDVTVGICVAGRGQIWIDDVTIIKS